MALAPLLLAALLAASPPASPAPPSPEVRERVRELLGAIHRGAPPEAFRAAGPGAEEALAEFARGGRPLQRIRALEALAGLGAPNAEAVHREAALGASAPPTVRKAAVRGLARLAGPARATAELAPVLERDRDATVRAAAAEALAAVAPGDACARIRAQAATERGPARFRRALAACDRSSRGAPR
jgi:HEAT repeat protein